MISFKEFKKRCLKELVDERKADDPEDLEKYLEEDDSVEIMEKFYKEGVERFKKNPNEKIAFGYCISTAAENLSLLY